VPFDLVCSLRWRDAVEQQLECLVQLLSAPKRLSLINVHSEVLLPNLRDPANFPPLVLRSCGLPLRLLDREQRLRGRNQQLALDRRLASRGRDRRHADGVRRWGRRWGKRCWHRRDGLARSRTRISRLERNQPMHAFPLNCCGPTGVEATALRLTLNEHRPQNDAVRPGSSGCGRHSRAVRTSHRGNTPFYPFGVEQVPDNCSINEPRRPEVHTIGDCRFVRSR